MVVIQHCTLIQSRHTHSLPLVLNWEEGQYNGSLEVFIAGARRAGWPITRTWPLDDLLLAQTPSPHTPSPFLPLDNICIFITGIPANMQNMGTREYLRRLRDALQRKSHLCISRKKIAQPHSHFHIYVFVGDLYNLRIGPHISCSRILYEDRPWEFINRLQTHECGNWDWGHAFLFLDIFV